MQIENNISPKFPCNMHTSLKSREKEMIFCYSKRRLMNRGDIMIVPLKGNVSFPITLDPSVWIFDDRKIILEEAFSKNKEQKKQIEPTQKSAELFDQSVYANEQAKPPINKSLTREEREKALTHSFVMPVKDFVETSEVNPTAEKALLKITADETIIISLEQLVNAFVLFAIEGKPVKNEGPIHLIFGDGSNLDNPIKGIQEIIIE